ncbi:unnamed protein product, partial [Protopolystoma xenopodis]
MHTIGVAGTQMLVTFGGESVYTDISGEKAVSVLLEVLEQEEDILEPEGIWKDSLTQLINLT